MWNIDIREYYPAITDKEVLAFAAKLTELEGALLGEASQIQKTSSSVLSITWMISRSVWVCKGL